MIGQLFIAERELEQVIAELTRSGSSAAPAQSQLREIAQMQRQIGRADAATLANLGKQVGAVVAQAQTLAQQGREAATQAEIRGDASLDAVSARTRATVLRVADDLFEKRVFDPYLRFNTPEEEAEYRRRESEREAYIKRELAKGTPEGARNASRAMVDQIEEAGRHGADQSPEYQRLLGEAQTALAEQDKAMAEPKIAVSPQKASSNPANQPADLNEIAAMLKEAGVTAPPDTIANMGHGLTATANERSSGQNVRTT